MEREHIYSYPTIAQHMYCITYVLRNICIVVQFINNEFKLIYNNTDKKIYNTITKYYKYK